MNNIYFTLCESKEYFLPSLEQYSLLVRARGPEFNSLQTIVDMRERGEKISLSIEIPKPPLAGNSRR